MTSKITFVPPLGQPPSAEITVENGTITGIKILNYNSGAIRYACCHALIGGKHFENCPQKTSPK